MATIDELQVKITADIADVNKKLSAVEKEVSQLANTVAKNSSKMSASFIAFGSAVGNVAARAITSAFRAISNSVSDAVTRLDTLNNFPRVMENLGISADKSTPVIDYLTEKLNGLPTAVDAAALSVQRFTSANGNIEASTNMFLALNNAILAGGASAEIQKSALEQMSQAYAKNKPDMMEWRTMMMAMPAQLKQVANAMGYADASALGESLRAGKVSMNDFMATIVRLNREGVNGLKSFEEQARGATGGVATSIVNLKTAITRGLANIMDAIGQTNISGFINAIGSAISVAANYIAAFIRLVLTAINALRALFGQSAIAFGRTSSAASDAANSVQSIGGAANDATDSLNGTGAAAKKLQKQLAGFDEMNVLREQDSGSGGGGGGGAGGGIGAIDLGALMDFDSLNTGADKVGEIADRIRAMLEGMFDFGKIGASIKQFVDDVRAGLTPIGNIISDIWNIYLKPLVSWTGNELLPAFLWALGGAIKFVGEVIGALWDVALKPFIDTFVVPIAEFAGSIITTTLIEVGNALHTLADNESTIQNIAIALAAIGVAVATWKIGDIALFVANMTKFKTLQNIVLDLGAAIEKANKKLSTFIKDGLKKIKNVCKDPISSIKDFATQMGTGISNAWSKVKGVFSGLADGFKNIVTHGGTTTNWIKGTALSAFDGLKNVLANLKTGVTNLWNAFLANPLGIIAGLFSVLMATNEEFRESVMNLVKAALQPLADIFSKVMSLLQPLIDIIVNLLTVALKPLTDILEAIAPIITVLLSVALLPLQAALEAIGWVIENIVKPALDAIASAFGWLGSLLGINTEKTDENSTAIENNANKADEARASLANYKEQIDENKNGEIEYSEAIQWVDSLLLARVNKELAVMNAEENRRKKTSELEEMCRQYGITLEEANALVDDGTNSHNLNATAVEDVTKKVLESRKADLELKQSKSELTKQIQENEKAIESAKEDYKDAAEKIARLGEQGVNSSFLMNTFKKKMEESKGVLDGFGISTNDLVNDKLSRLKTAYGNATSKLQQMSDGTKYSREEFEQQKKACQAVENAIKNLGGSIAPLKSYQDIIYNQGKETYRKGQEGFQKNKGTFDNYLMSAGSSSGTFWGNGIVSGVNNKIRDAYNAGVRLANAANQGYRDTNRIASPSKVAKQLAGFWGEGIALGMEGKINDVESAAQRVAEAANTSFEDAIEPLNMSIANSAAEFGSNLETSLSDVIEANSQTHVTVKVGEDTLINKVIDGINESSFLANRGVINI